MWMFWATQCKRYVSLMLQFPGSLLIVVYNSFSSLANVVTTFPPFLSLFLVVTLELRAYILFFYCSEIIRHFRMPLSCSEPNSARDDNKPSTTKSKIRNESRCSPQVTLISMQRYTLLRQHMCGFAWQVFDPLRNKCYSFCRKVSLLAVVKTINK